MTDNHACLGGRLASSSQVSAQAMADVKEPEAVQEAAPLPVSSSAPASKPPAEKAPKVDVSALAAKATTYAKGVVAEMRTNAAEVNAQSLKTKSASYQKLVTAYADSLLGDGTPASKAVLKASPVLGQVAAVLALAAPFVITLVLAMRDAYVAVLYTLPWHAIELLSGLFLCFFGGEFYALIACYEAFYACGGPDAAAAAKTVVDEAQAVVTAAALEKAASDTNPRAAVRRNVLLFATNTHPEALTAAMGKLWATGLGMLATMKLKLAQTMVLSTRISKALVPVATRHVLPKLESTVPPEMHKWNATLLEVGITTLVLLVASFFSSLVASFHAALRGGQLAAKHAVAILAERGTLKGPVDDKLIHTVGLLLSTAGVLAQAGLGFRLPFPLNVLLLPLTTAELTLRVTIGFASL